MASTVLTMIHGQAIGGAEVTGTSGLMAIAASTPAAMKGTVTLSSIPSGNDSAMALTSTATATATSCGAPNSRVMANAAAPPKTMNAANPPHDLARFHGSGANGRRWPMTVENPSPNASSTQATAAISRCQLKTTIRTVTAKG